MSPATDSENIQNRTFLDLVRQRKSCRSYLPDPVSREELVSIVEAARLAPSACNKQPWRIIVVTEGDLKGRILETAILPGIAMPWAADAPALIVLGVRRAALTHRLAPRISGIDYALLDAGIAGEHMVLQATALGLGTCWIGWIRPGVVRKLVGWTTDIAPVALLTLGKEKPGEQPPERPRLPMDDIVTWRGPETSD